MVAGKSEEGVREPSGVERGRGGGTFWGVRGGRGGCEVCLKASGGSLTAYGRLQEAGTGQVPLWLSSARCYILHYKFCPGVDRSQVRHVIYCWCVPRVSRVLFRCYFVWRVLFRALSMGLDEM